MALSLSLAGLVDQYLLLAQFNIGLADYADIDDFLVAAISFLDRPYRALFMFVYGFLFPILVAYLSSLLINKHRERTEQLETLDTNNPNLLKKMREKNRNHSLILNRSSEMIRIMFWLGVSTVPFIAWYTAPTIETAQIEKSFCEVSVELKLPGPNFRYSDSPIIGPSIKESESKTWLISGINASMFIVERTKDNKYISHALPTAAIAQVRYLSCPNETLGPFEQLGIGG